MATVNAWDRTYLQRLASIPQWAWEDAGLRYPEDGMFLEYRGKPVWAPVTEQQCLDVIKASADEHDQAYHAAYVAGDYEGASRIYRRKKRHEWYGPHDHRVRKSRLEGAFGSHTSAEWEAVLTAHGRRCAECRTTERLEKDHKIPLVAGGSDMAVNLQPLCKSCNSAKSGRIRIGTQIGIFDRVVIRDTKGQTIKKRGAASKPRARAYGEAR